MRKADATEALLAAWRGEIGLEAESPDRHRVLTPFMFDDGDHLVIYLRAEGEGWILTDEGHTLMHLSYRLDEEALESAGLERVLGILRATLQVQDREGELVLPLGDAAPGPSLYHFAQAVLSLARLEEPVRHTERLGFLLQLLELMAASVPADLRRFNWTDRDRDPDGWYPVDCHVVSAPEPHFVFGIPKGDDQRAGAVTRALAQFGAWRVAFRSVVVFEDQESIDRAVLARLSDLCDKQFASIDANRERVKAYLQEVCEPRLHESRRL